MFKEVNTATNLPAQIDLYATPGDYYKFLFMAKVCVCGRTVVDAVLPCIDRTTPTRAPQKRAPLLPCSFRSYRLSLYRPRACSWAWV
jgi:hypothetical protein